MSISCRRYGRGVIVRRYTSGQRITVAADITANHKGYFEFRLCPQNNPAVPVTEACLDRYLLAGDGGTRYSRLWPPVACSPPSRYYLGEGTRRFSTSVKLPVGLSCRHCVLQWRYVGGNNWGICPGGQAGVGCGHQEEFRACADVAIGQGRAGAARPGTLRPGWRSMGKAKSSRRAKESKKSKEPKESKQRKSIRKQYVDATNRQLGLQEKFDSLPKNEAKSWSLGSRNNASFSYFWSALKTSKSKGGTVQLSTEPTQYSGAGVVATDMCIRVYLLFSSYKLVK